MFILISFIHPCDLRNKALLLISMVRSKLMDVKKLEEMLFNYWQSLVD